jgi:hypothetical protein
MNATVDEQGLGELVELAMDDVRERMPAAAAYHQNVVWQAVPGGGTPAEYKSTGDEAASIHTVRTPDGWKVVVGEFYSAFHEFGSKHEPAKHTVFRATMAAVPGIIDILSGREPGQDE